ncbi:MAG: MFS transporter [Polyangiales bacterium]
MKPRWTAYQRRLIWFLSVATFFEGYDMFALSQLLPEIRHDFALSRSAAGWMLAAINLGTVIAFVLVGLADRWGRRRVLSVTIAGYTVCSLASAFAPDAVTFTLAQLLARIFLIGEWAVASVVAAEEYPAEDRGTVIGLVSACGSLGSIVCAGVVPLLLKTAPGWRAVYMVGAVPLILLAFARRGLRETERFEREAPATPKPLISAEVLRGPSRPRVLRLGAIWALTYVCTQNTITFWKEFAVSERGLDSAAVGKMITLAALVSMPAIFFAGRLIDRLGRRGGAAVIYGALSVGAGLAYTLRGRTALNLALILAVFGVSAVLAVLNAYTTELFATRDRAEAFAWSNNLLGRITYVLSPIGLGYAAERVGWGVSVGSTALFALGALGLILLWLPETRGRELEETAKE